MEKLVCTQCGGNELKPFGAFAYKCESCGTILKEEEKTAPAPPPAHFSAPVRDFRYDDENDDYEPLSRHTDGSDIDNPDTSAIKLILYIILAIIAAGGLLYLLFSK